MFLEGPKKYRYKYPVFRQRYEVAAVARYTCGTYKGEVCQRHSEVPGQLSLCIDWTTHTVLRTKITFQFLVEAKYFFLLHIVQTTPAARPTPQSNDTAATFPQTSQTTEVNNA
jgi:hypothetical protein